MDIDKIKCETWLKNLIILMKKSEELNDDEVNYIKKNFAIAFNKYESEELQDSDESLKKENKVLEITQVRITKMDIAKNIRANVSVVINNALIIHDIKIFEGKNGLFVGRLSRRNESGYHIDIMSIIDKEFNKKFSDAILDEYYKERLKKLK